ncbi:hypothetical protein QQS21_012503 [Conoideocrella luteorostrata]|uniref:S-adenosyl-L-methionine-dependent methyltransferase n=1 Tax=Conoideocrella luteorostrata TaxID=1105319 RepID=A0AAJ0FSM6_9HYPO|nr:hypothetical protein QQS21_012503 [Conoideocrella luteorostrata]
MAWQFSARDFVLGIVVGGVVTIVILSVGLIMFIRSSNIYGLGHWKLNVRTPLPSMWMNLGFWKSDDGKPIINFSEATRALLEKMVDTAGLLVKDDATSDTRDAIAVLDLGFGCGDQTIALADMIQAQKRPRFRYVGLTLNASQVQTAQRTLHRSVKLENDAVADGLTRDSFKLYRANAAKPETWSRAVRTSVDTLADESFSERWLLALDCLYHFSPSRKPIFKFAAQTLDAHAMVFDLVLNEKASKLNTLLIRVVGYILSCPFYTFLTKEQYRDQLIECGYDRAHIEIIEISDHVFAGLSAFLRRQDTALSQYGIGIGGFKLVGRIYEWLDRTRVVNAVIVVARTKGKVAKGTISAAPGT